MPATATLQAFVTLKAGPAGEATVTLDLRDLDLDFLVDAETLDDDALVAVEEAVALLRSTVLTLTATARP